MKHHRPARKFNRTKNQRAALLRSLMLSLVVHNKITTTLAKAKEVRPHVEKLLTRSRIDNLANRRYVAIQIGPRAAKKLFEETAPKFKGRKGGYTRVIKMPPRLTDNAEMGIIEFVA